MYKKHFFLDNLALFHRFSRNGQELFVGYHDWRVASTPARAAIACTGIQSCESSCLFELSRSFPLTSF